MANSSYKTHTLSHLSPQQQEEQPGKENKMNPLPQFERPDEFSAKRLKNKVAIITGGDSGIGRATAIAFAKEGADVAIFYLNEHEDANLTKKRVEEIGQKCLISAFDAGNSELCIKNVNAVVEQLGHLEILINNCAEQHVRDDIEKLSPQDLERTFKTNIFSYFFMVQASLKYLKAGSSIINTTSVVAYKGHEELLDYASTKGAIVAYTRSLAQRLVKRGIRVNSVAPGPIWTPLIPASFSAEHVEKFGKNVPMQRAGQPCEVAPSFVFLASEDASYMTGQVLHPNGGTPIAS